MFYRKNAGYGLILMVFPGSGRQLTTILKNKTKKKTKKEKKRCFIPPSPKSVWNRYCKACLPRCLAR